MSNPLMSEEVPKLRSGNVRSCVCMNWERESECERQHGKSGALPLERLEQSCLPPAYV